MGVVTASSSVVRSPVRLNVRNLTCVSLSRRPVIFAFKNDKSKNTALIASRESVALPVEGNKENVKRLRKVKKRAERVNAILVEEASPSALELDYSEAAAKLENIYKISPAIVSDEEELKSRRVKRRQPRRKRTGENEENEKKNDEKFIRSQRKGKRLSLENRISLRTMKDIALMEKKKHSMNDEDEKIDRLLREHTSSTVSGGIDWKRMQIPPVLPSSEQAWLFKLMQPMKAILKVKEVLQKDLERGVRDDELAKKTKMDCRHLRKQLEVGRAARNKLIKHNLRLVLFVMNRYFKEFKDGPSFEDLCQAGFRGLITAIDRFEPNKKSRLSTYGLFWIRHAMVRFMTVSNVLKIPFGLESVRAQIQKAKSELSVELQRKPSTEEIIERAGISRERYHDVMRASKPVYSLHARDRVTQEPFINGITDDDSVDGDKTRQTAILRLALDDVLDSLKPKENLVIRQRYGLDGRGNRTLGEIAGNMNMSREMVRKYELKALMKLKHPTRLDYLRRVLSK